MIIDFRSEYPSTNLRRIFVEAINQRTWFHSCFIDMVGNENGRGKVYYMQFV